MAKYIEREKLIDELQHLPEQGELDYLGVFDCVNTTPTADVVKVVRCKDCEYCCISTDPKTNISVQKCGYVGFNPVQSSQVSDDFYCSYGELKECEGK
jgi:hypothetical protein